MWLSCEFSFLCSIWPRPRQRCRSLPHDSVCSYFRIQEPVAPKVHPAASNVTASSSLQISADSTQTPIQGSRTTADPRVANQASAMLSKPRAVVSQISVSNPQSKPPASKTKETLTSVLSVDSGEQSQSSVVRPSVQPVGAISPSVRTTSFQSAVAPVAHVTGAPLFMANTSPNAPSAAVPEATRPEATGHQSLTVPVLVAPQRSGLTASSRQTQDQLYSDVTDIMMRVRCSHV